MINAQVDEYIEREMQRQKIPGIALGVFRNGEILHARGYGYSNVEHEVPFKLQTIFQSGSVGKQFTAMAIMILVEQGRLQLDERINRHFTDAPSEWQNITVRHLLTHTSGMGDYPDEFDFRADYTDEDLYRVIRAVPLTFQPGDRYDYSNFGYVMLGFLIRRVTGLFYGDFLRQVVFGPLNMTTARVMSEADIIKNRASGYLLVDGELQNQRWVSPSLNTQADGSLYLTLLDMVKWDAGLYGRQLLRNQSSYDAMWSPVVLNNQQTYPYGFGWRLNEAVNSMRVISHGGSWQGFLSKIIRVPEDQLTVVVFLNLNQRVRFDPAQHVLEMYNSQLALKPEIV